MYRAIVLLAALACRAPAPPTPAAVPAPPPVELELAAPWQVVEQDETQVVLRHGDTPDGVRLNLTRTAAGRWPGIAPIVAGRTWEIREGDRIRPAFTAPLADRPPSRVVVSSQGPDLLIRYEGVPLAGLVDHPDAPTDPVLTWVRLRPRPGSLRIVLQGLHVVSLPAPVAVDERGDGRTLTTPWGRLEVDDAAPAARSVAGPTSWWLDTTPSADALAPYPRTGLTWWPARPVSP